LAAAPSRPLAWLVITSGDHRGTRFALDKDELTIGRGGDNDIPLDDPSVSDRHAKLRTGDEEYYLTDLDTTSGTLVNGQRISRQALHPDDEVVVGETVLRFLRLPGNGAGHVGEVEVT